MCHQPPRTDVCITFKSSLMRGRFRRGAPLFIGLYDSYGFAMHPPSTHFFTKYVTLEYSSYLSNNTNI